MLITQEESHSSGTVVEVYTAMIHTAIRTNITVVTIVTSVTSVAVTVL